MSLYTAADGQRIEIRTKVTSTAETQIYPSSGTVPDNKTRAFIESLNFCNITGTAATIDLYVNDGSTDFYILKAYSIAANSVYKVDGLPAGVRTGDSIKVLAGTANAIDVVGVVVEQYPGQKVAGL